MYAGEKSFQGNSLSKQIAIVGAGIGGLCCALALVKRGFSVAVYEQASQIQEVGAGLQLSPNAVHVLRRLGIAEQLKPYVFSPHSAVMRHYQTGKSYFSVPLGSHCLELYGAEYWHVHRADLQQVLYQACFDNKVKVHLASPVLGYARQQDSVQVSLLMDKQPAHDFDVVIGADGIHSKIQQTLLKQLNLKSVPRFTGQVAWRGTVNVQDLPPQLVEPNANLWVGPGRHFVSYYLRAGHEINFVAVEERSDWRDESWQQQGDINQLRQTFSGWHPQVSQILQATQRSFLWALHDREPLSTWVDHNVALLGDACHPMLPFLAQGAAMAIEDSYVLAAMLSQHQHSHIALQHYQQQRLTRTRQIQLGARNNASLYHMRTVADRTKLGLLGAMANSGLSSWLAAQKLDSIYAHNVVQDFA